MVGLGQMIFYLLLLSLAESAGFDLGFAMLAGFIGLAAVMWLTRKLGTRPGPAPAAVAAQSPAGAV